MTWSTTNQIYSTYSEIHCAYTSQFRSASTTWCIIIFRIHNIICLQRNVVSFIDLNHSHRTVHSRRTKSFLSRVCDWTFIAISARTPYIICTTNQTFIHTTRIIDLLLHKIRTNEYKADSSIVPSLTAKS